MSKLLSASPLDVTKPFFHKETKFSPLSFCSLAILPQSLQVAKPRRVKLPPLYKNRWKVQILKETGMRYSVLARGTLVHYWKLPINPTVPTLYEIHFLPRALRDIKRYSFLTFSFVRRATAISIIAGKYWWQCRRTAQLDASFYDLGFLKFYTRDHS